MKKRWDSTIRATYLANLMQGKMSLEDATLTCSARTTTTRALTPAGRFLRPLPNFWEGSGRPVFPTSEALSRVNTTRTGTGVGAGRRGAAAKIGWRPAAIAVRRGRHCGTIPADHLAPRWRRPPLVERGHQCVPRGGARPHSKVAGRNSAARRLPPRRRAGCSHSANAGRSASPAVPLRFPRAAGPWPASSRRSWPGSRAGPASSQEHAGNAGSRALFAVRGGISDQRGQFPPRRHFSAISEGQVGPRSTGPSRMVDCRCGSFYRR